jgi:hypothetical protein
VAEELNLLDLSKEKERKTMRKKTIALSLSCVLLASVIGIKGQEQHPILDQVANKVIQKYQTASCHFRGRQNLQHPPRHPLPSPRSRCVKAQQIEI